MTFDLSVSVGGYRAATERLETSVNNLVNSRSTAKLEQDGTFSNEPYRPQQVQPIAQAEGGVGTVKLERANPTVREYQPQSAVADAEGFVEVPNVDAATEIVNQTIASYDAKANIRAIQIQSEIFESTLDIFT